MVSEQCFPHSLTAVGKVRNALNKPCLMDWAVILHNNSSHYIVAAVITVALDDNEEVEETVGAVVLL